MITVTIKRSAKSLGARTARMLGNSQSSHRRRIIGLCYHSVHPERSFASVTPDVFRRHLEWLTAECDVIPFRSIPDVVSGPLRTRPAVAITFDDGYDDNYDFAFPLLVEYRTPATVFLTAGLVNGDSRRSRSFPRPSCIELLRAQATQLEPSARAEGGRRRHWRTYVQPPKPHANRWISCSMGTPGRQAHHRAGDW